MLGALRSLKRSRPFDLSPKGVLSHQVGATGFEPAIDFAGNDNLPCGCVICEAHSAANALHCGVAEWLDVALNDIELQRVVVAWSELPEAIKAAIAALVGSIVAIE